MSEYNSEEIQNTGEEDNQNVTNLVSSMGRLSILYPLPNIPSQVKPSSAKDKQLDKKQDEVPQDNQDENAVAHCDADLKEENDGHVKKDQSNNLNQEKIQTDEQNQLKSDGEGNLICIPTEKAVAVDKKEKVEQTEKDAKDSPPTENADAHHHIYRNEEDDYSVERGHSYNLSQEKIKADDQKEHNSASEGNHVHVPAKEVVTNEKKTSKVCLGTEERNEKDEETKEKDDKNDKETKEKNKHAEEVGEEDHSDDENPVDDDEFQKEVKRQPRLLQRGLEGGGFHQPQYYAQQTSFPRTHWQGNPEVPVANLHYDYAASGFQSPQYAQSADFPEMFHMQGGVADSRMFNRDVSENSSDISSSGPSSPEQDAGCQSESGDQHDIGLVLEAVQRVINDQDILPVPAQILSEIKEYLYCETPEVDNQKEVSAEHCDLPSPNFQPIQHVNTSYSIPISQNQDNLAVQLHDPDWKMMLDQSLLHQYRRKLAKQTNEKITEKDEDGDTPSMVIACADVGGVGYLEKLVAVLERQKDIHMCCDTVVSRGMICSICGNTDENKFYSSLGIKNHEGHSILSSVIAMNHPKLVIECIIDYIKCRKSDIQRVFNNFSLQYYYHHQLQYPALSQFLGRYFALSA